MLGAAHGAGSCQSSARHGVEAETHAQKNDTGTADAPTPSPVAQVREGATVPRRKQFGTPPARREGPQLHEVPLERVLQQAEAALTAGDPITAQRLVSQCANKIPASARCDGEYGLRLSKHTRRSRETLYYLQAAAETDDPRAGEGLYRQISNELRKRGEYGAAEAAARLALARKSSVDNFRALSNALVSVANRRSEAADALASARLLNHDTALLHEEAVLRAQVRGETRRAIALFEEFRAQTSDGPSTAKDDALEARINELKQQAQADDTPASSSK